MKILIRLAVAVLVLLVAVLVGITVYIDAIASSAIEKGASYALGVDTKVGFVHIAPFQGTFRIGSFKIENPPGFEERYLMTLDDGFLAVDLDSLQRPIVEVPMLTFDDIAVDLEKAGGQTNYGVILGNLGRFEKSGSAPPQDAEKQGPGKRFIVKELLIRNISAHVAHNEALGAIGGIDVAVPEVRLVNVGAHNAKGVAMDELTNIIMKAIFASIAKYGTNLPALLTGDLTAQLGSLSRVPVRLAGTTAETLTKDMPKPIGDAAKQLGGEAGQLLEKGLGGLLGGKQKE
ncbi:MAG: hypothetical protein ACE5FL_00890 [Myxococcota bacterium]